MNRISQIIYSNINRIIRKPNQIILYWLLVNLS